MLTLQKRLGGDLSKFYVGSFLITLLIAFVFYFPYAHVIGSLDSSMPYRFYLWIYPGDNNKEEKIRRYRYVEVYVADLTQYPPIEKKGVRYLIKKAVCFPGDTLETKGMAFFCNGEYIGEAVRMSVPNFTYKGEIPEGYYFVIGTHPKSFDSRYLGLISEERITGVLIPIY